MRVNEIIEAMKLLKLFIITKYLLIFLTSEGAHDGIWSVHRNQLVQPSIGQNDNIIYSQENVFSLHYAKRPIGYNLCGSVNFLRANVIETYELYLVAFEGFSNDFVIRQRFKRNLLADTSLLYVLK